jgi:hypothetical protein
MDVRDMDVRDMDVRAVRLARVDHGQEVGGRASNPQQDAGGGRVPAPHQHTQPIGGPVG